MCPARNKDPLMQIGRMHQHNIKWEVLQTARRFKAEVQRVTKQIKENSIENNGRWRGKRCMEKYHVT
jgi:hypothetical protein